MKTRRKCAPDCTCKRHAQARENLKKAREASKKLGDDLGRRISESKLGYRHSEETRKKISESKKGRPGHTPSQETRKKISLANKGNPGNPGKCEPGCTCGRHRTRTPEERERLSRGHKKGWETHRESRLAAARSEEKRKKASISGTKAWRDPEVRKKYAQAWNGTDEFKYRPDGEGRLFIQRNDHPLGPSYTYQRVLFDSIGYGPHLCFWCYRPISWKRGTAGLFTDHVDRDPSNNDITNLVPSCIRCNTGRRGNTEPGHRSTIRPTYLQ